MNHMATSTIIAGGLALGMVSGAANAGLTYDTWSSNEAPNGSYSLTVNENASTDRFDVSLTVDPWDAEALGLFIDFGDVDLDGSMGIYDAAPTGEVSLYATDTGSSFCGPGCNLNGLSNPAVDGGDGEWEAVLRLGQQGFDGIQTFSWSMDRLGLSEADWGVVGVRAQNMCAGDDTLEGGDKACGDSDKVFGTPTTDVPEPMSLLLLAGGLLGAGVARRR